MSNDLKKAIAAWAAISAVGAIFVVLVLLVEGCSDVKASGEAINCQVEKKEIVWQADSVCGLDKDGNQMVSVGSFENPKRQGCLALSWVCRMN
jgi:hypothetical protein